MRCRNTRSGCGATARVYRNNIDELIEGLPHGPGCVRSPEAAHITRFKEELRQAATRDYGEPRRIYDALAAVYPEAAALVPFRTVLRGILRWRRTSFPPSPQSLVELTLQLSDPGRDGLFNHDAGTITKRVFRDVAGDTHFLFYDADIVVRIRNNTETLMKDFTYKTCPIVPDANLQLGTVMCIYHGHALPIMWFLMSRKTTNAYRKMCEIIRELMQGANILTVVTDFEMPLKTALRETFGERVYLIGCFFHFLRCLNGKIHRLGLSDYVKNDAEANRFVR
uniref:MULE transposase domain-containing protein n=1 Tax=Trichogramma kaykai TaxID=54128 RepID=A0ABD2W2D1_9HYME